MTEPTATPRPIRIARIIALIVGAGGLLQAIVAFTEQRTLNAGLFEVGKYMSTEQAIYRTTNLRGSVSLALVLGIAALVLFTPVALLISRRVRWTRIATWIVGGGLIVGEVVLMSADSSAVKTGKFVNDIDVPGSQPELVTRLNAMLVPDWFPPLHYTAELIVLVGVIAVCVQLLLAGSADYFHADDDAQPVASDDARVWSTEKMRASRSD